MTVENQDNNFGDRQQYIWSVGDVRRLDKRLQSIYDLGKKNEATLKTFTHKINSSHKVIVGGKRGRKEVWAGIGVLIGTAVATLIGLLQGRY